MSTSYESDPDVEYCKVVNGVQICDVGGERQVQFTAADMMTLAVTPRHLTTCALGVCSVESIATVKAPQRSIIPIFFVT